MGVRVSQFCYKLKQNKCNLRLLISSYIGTEVKKIRADLNSNVYHLVA